MKARRMWATPLVPLYAAALRLKNHLLQTGYLKTRALQWPVISVGSLSAGGAGKTPVVIALAKLFQDEGWKVDVLTRGYGRDDTSLQLVNVANDDAARLFGDEPVLIARITGAPVWVGADRFTAGQRAEAMESSHKRAVHLLDDGFQHRKLARTIDVVLVTEEDFEDTLLPAGNLREEMFALARADVAIVREDEFDAVAKRVWALMRQGAQMWTVRRTLRFPAPLFVFGAGLRPVAFCAIARPEGFAQMLQAAGCGVIETVAFADHHRYSMADIERVIEVAKGMGGSGFVTTEKDAVKLSTAMRQRMEAAGSLMVVSLEAEFTDRASVLRAVKNKLVGAEAMAK